MNSANTLCHWSLLSMHILTVCVNRNVLVASAEHCGYCTATGSDRTPHTSTLRWSVLIRSMQQSATTQTFSGCASRWWSTARCVVSPRLHASHVVSARVTATARRSAARAVLAGSAATLRTCTASDRQWQSTALQDTDILACRTLSLCLRLLRVLIKAVCSSL